MTATAAAVGGDGCSCWMLIECNNNNDDGTIIWADVSILFVFVCGSCFFMMHPSSSWLIYGEVLPQITADRPKVWY